MDVLELLSDLTVSISSSHTRSFFSESEVGNLPAEAEEFALGAPRFLLLFFGMNGSTDMMGRSYSSSRDFGAAVAASC